MIHAVIRQCALRGCFILLALFTAAVLFTSTADAAIGPYDDSGAALPVQDAPAIGVSASPANPGSPCKRHKARTHHSCSICIHHVLVQSFNRNRDKVPSLPQKDLKAKSDTDRIALAAQNAAVRLLLARYALSLPAFPCRSLLDSTARLRN